MWDTLDLAAELLTEGGRLCYLHPATPDITLALLPSHPLLRLEAVSEERLTPLLSRLLILMVRLPGPYSRQARGQYRAAACSAAEAAEREALLIRQSSSSEAGAAGGTAGGAAAGSKGGLRGTMNALLDAWYDKHQGNAKLYEDKLATLRSAGAGSASAAGAAAEQQGSGAGSSSSSSAAAEAIDQLSRKSVKMQQRRLFRQSKRQERLAAVAAAAGSASSGGSRAGAGAGGAAEAEAEAEAAPAAAEADCSSGPPPPQRRRTVGKSEATGLSKGQRRAARIAAAEADLAAGKAVKISGVPFDTPLW